MTARQKYNLRKMTNAELDAAITAEAEKAQVAGLETTAALDALFDERSWRIKLAQERAQPALYGWTPKS